MTSDGKTVALCHGVFDLMHFGQMVHLREAKDFGDLLVVSIVADEFVRKPGRPLLYDENTRRAMLYFNKFVDRVIICNAIGPEDVIATLRPDVYVRGPDYIGKQMPESGILRKLRIPVRYTSSTHPRTTEIMAQLYDLYHQHKMAAA